MSQPRPEPDLLQAVSFWLALCGFVVLVQRGHFIGILAAAGCGLVASWGLSSWLRMSYEQLIKKAPTARVPLLVFWPVMFFVLSYGCSLFLQPAFVFVASSGSLTSWEGLPQTSWMLDHATNKLIYGMGLMATAVQWRKWLIVGIQPTSTDDTAAADAPVHKCDHC